MNVTGQNIPRKWLVTAAVLLAVTVPFGVYRAVSLGERAAAEAEELAQRAAALPAEFRDSNGASYARQLDVLTSKGEPVPSALRLAAKAEARLGQARMNQVFSWAGVAAGAVAAALLAAGAAGLSGAPWMLAGALAAVAFIAVNAAPIVVAEKDSALAVATDYGHFAAAACAAMACFAALRGLDHRVHYAACCSVLGAVGLFFAWWELPPPVPLPPQRPIADLASALVPPGWSAEPIELDPIIEGALGADEYLQLSLRPPGGRREVSLFVPYYSDAFSNIPHVPQVCMRAAGFEPTGDREGTLLVPGLAGREVPLNLLAFRRPNAPLQVVMMMQYLGVGWTYFRDRQAARLAATTGALGEEGSYMSQTQIVVPLLPGEADDPLSEESEAYDLGRQLLQHVVPILEDRYYPRQSAAADAAEPPAVMKEVDGRWHAD